jgi:hypothetical protein
MHITTKQHLLPSRLGQMRLRYRSRVPTAVLHLEKNNKKKQKNNKKIKKIKRTSFSTLEYIFSTFCI